MAKRVLFIHGAGPQGTDRGSGPLLGRLRRELGGGIPVEAPSMPSPTDPDCAVWQRAIAGLVGELEEGTILVGHSLGGSVILKTLAKEEPVSRVAAVCSIAAPYWGADPDWPGNAFALPADAAERLAWLRRIHLFHSRDDELVPFGHLAFYESLLPWARAHRCDGTGHCFDRGGTDGLAEEIRRMIRHGVESPAE